MSTEIQNGAMMVREGFVMPNLAGIESRSYSPAWRTMVGINNFTAEKSLRDADLHLFFLAGELRVLQPGWGSGAIRRGIKRLLAMGRKSQINCMEITQISPARFLGLPFVAIRAYRFHIQKGSMLHSSAERKSEQSNNDWACG
jgi:hypothetical protein